MYTMINNLKLKHRIHVTHESEDHKTILLAQEEIQQQVVKKAMSFFEATKKRSNILEKLFQALITFKAKSVESEKAFSTSGLFVTKLRNRLIDESVLSLSCVSVINIIAKLCLI